MLASSQSLSQNPGTMKVDSFFNGVHKYYPMSFSPPNQVRSVPNDVRYRIANMHGKIDDSIQLLNDASNCNTYTFSARLMPPSGDSLSLIEISPMLSKETIVATNQVRGGNKSILLFKLAQDGSIAQQLQLRIDGRQVIGAGMQVRQQREVMVTGYFADNAKQVFLASFTLDFQLKWVKRYDLDAAVELMKSDLRSTFGCSIVVQSDASYKVLKLREDGEIQWATSMDRAPGTSLRNINYQTTDILLISQRDTSGSLPAYALTALAGSNGQLIETRRAEHLQDSVILTDFKGFDNRSASAGVVKKTDGSTSIFVSHAQQRDISFYNYYYSLPIPFPLQGTVLVSPSLDAIAAYEPASNQLYLITQHYYDNIRPRRQRQFSISGAHELTSFVKTVDAGFMFGLTGSNGQIMLIKTDSIGMLPGCDSRTLQVGFEWVRQIQHSLANKAVQSPLTTSLNIGTLSSLAGAGTITFNCREKYCPTIPLEDSCTPSFFRILRSNYFGSGVYSGFFQKSKLYTYGQVYEDISAPTYAITGMLGSYDLKGNHIKSIRTYINDAPAASNLWPYKDGRSLAAYSLGKYNERQHFLICMFDEALNPKWTTAIESYYTWNSYSFAPVVTDIVYDDNGDIFVIIPQSDLQKENRNVSIIKLDAVGKFQWSKSFQINNRSTGATNATVTPDALVILSESTQPGAFTLALSKTDGALLAKTSFANNSSYGVSIESNRLFRYHNGKIYYVGTYAGDTPDASGIAAAILNSLGQPEAFNYYVSVANSRLDASLANDKIDIATATNTMGGYKTIKVQLNLALEVVHAYAYAAEHYLSARAVLHDSLGNTHELGFLNARDEYSETSHYLIKYNPDGSIGSCAKEPIAFKPQKIGLVDHPLDIELSTKAFRPGGNFQLQVFEDENGMQVAKLQCLSQATCKTLKLDGPGAYCDPMKEYVVKMQKTPGCSLPVIVTYDTAIIKDVIINQSEIQFKTNNPGTTWLKALLNSGCDLFQDSIRITVPNAGLALNLGPDLKLCPGDSLTLSAGARFSSYSWNTGTSDSLLKVKTPGTYWIAVTNGCGTIKRDTIVISKPLVPALSAGADTAVCLGTNITRVASPGFASYQWARMSDLVRVSTSSDFSQSITGDERFKITAITADGCMKTDSFKVIMKTARPFNLGSDTSLCKGDSVVFSAPTGYKSYKWNTGYSGQFIVAKQVGIYSVSVIDMNDCATSDTITIVQVRDVPLPQLGPDKSICAGSATILNPGSFVGYQWQDGDNSATKTANSVGWYSVKVWDQWGCRSIDSMRITALLPIPQNFLKNTDSICQYETLKIEPNQKFADYTWSTGSRNNVITVSQPGLITLKVTDNIGCVGSDSIRIVQKSCMEGVYVPNAFTPNKDGRNDNFKPLTFGKVVYYDFKIFNRYGEIVFNSSVPGEAWDGVWKGLPQPSGNFVWQCNYQLEGKERKNIKGTVVLIR
jgi:gliding motility-associated-like protein